MRMTVRLDPDVAAGVEKLRQERPVSASAAINELARQGLARTAVAHRERFVQRTADLGLAIDVHNVAEALDYLDGAGHS